MKLADGTTVISNGQLIDGTGAPPIRDAALVVTDGRIRYAGGVASAPPVPADARRIDARGGTIMPGLVEAHFHPTYFNVAALEDLDIKYPVEYVTILAACNAKLALECGYTAARSGGSLFNSDHWLKKAIENDLIPGPRLAASGREICGVGFVAIHYTVFVPTKKGGDQFLDWCGGYFDYESGPKPRGWYSKIQTCVGKVHLASPKHPISRGLKPFELREEFYYNMRLAPGDHGLTPILNVAIPNEKESQVVAWAVQRKNGGRGFGYTGGHFHSNWHNENVRRMVLNALVWTAQGQVPDGGVQSTLPKEEQPANGPSSDSELDYRPADARLKAIRIDRSLDEWFVVIKADTMSRLFVGGREALFVYDPDEKGGYKPRRELLRFPPDAWIAGLEVCGD